VAEFGIDDENLIRAERASPLDFLELSGILGEESDWYRSAHRHRFRPRAWSIREHFSPPGAPCRDSFVPVRH